jgi:hypothetical protein
MGIGLGRRFAGYNLLLSINSFALGFGECDCPGSDYFRYSRRG